MSITKTTLRHPVLTLIVFVLLGILGIFTLKDAAIALMPDIDSPYLSVNTIYENAGPESVEKSVTKLLEGQLISVSGLKNLTSSSSEGRSSIWLEFNYGTDLDIATNDVRDKLDRVTRRLPDDADSPTIFKMDSDSMPIMRIAVRGSRPRNELREIADDTICDLIAQTEGVAEASVSGGRDKIVRVDISQNRLAAYGLTMMQVSQAMSSQNLELGAGKITEGSQDYSIRTTGEFSSIEEVNDTVIAVKNGYAVRLSDIGTAYMGYADKTNEVYINGQEGVYISVTKQSGKNSVTVANAVYEKLDEIREIIPGDMSLEIIRDTTDSIRETINTLLESAGQGLVLAVLILFLGIIFTVVIALVSSLFVAVFLVPVLAGKFLPLTNRKEKPVKNKFLKRFYAILDIPMNALTGIYRNVLAAALKNRAITITICVAVLITAFALIPTMTINMMPNGEEDSVGLNVTLPIGTTLEETTEVMKQLEQIVNDEVKGYKNLIVSVGTGNRNATAYKGSIQIQLPKSEEQIDSAQDIQQKLRAHFSDFAGARFNFDQGGSRQMTGSDIKIKVRSDDLDAALRVSSQIREVMEGISELGEVTIDTEEGVPQVEIEIDRERAYSFGVDVTTVAREIYYAINGVNATTYRDAGKEYDLTIAYRPDDRKSVEDLEQIYVNGSNGKVSVANFAKVVKGLGPVTIRRENQTRRVTITADMIVENVNAYEVENKIKEGIAASFIVPDNVSISYEGSWQDMQEQGAAYAGIALMAILLVFGVMAGTYESFKAPFINLCTIPFLIVGVVFIYKISGQAISMMSAVGLIMLVGIVVNNGIILVDYTNLLIDRGKTMYDACLEAGVSRLRPVLMTTLTTILGMLPMCFATSGSAGMVQPIGVAVVGGLTSSTFITLFFIPVLYSLVMKEKKREKSHLEILLTEEKSKKK